MAAALGVIGSVVGFIGQQKQAKAAKRAEALRERQMNLEAARKKRELIREGVVARGQARATAEAQGAGAGSGIAGGLGQITGQQGRNIQANSQDQQIGAGIFSANRQYAAGGTIASIGSGISSLGSIFK